jgi:hypothetical protein
MLGVPAKDLDEMVAVTASRVVLSTVIGRGLPACPPMGACLPYWLI